MTSVFKSLADSVCHRGPALSAEAVRMEPLAPRMQRVEKRLHSYRQADALLGARHGTVAKLVERGLLRAVSVGRRQKIPAVELERIAREGWSFDGPKQRQRAVPLRSVRTGTGGDAVRALRI